MEEILERLERIQALILRQPDRFTIKNSDQIFELLENNDYDTVLNIITQNNKDEYKNKRKRTESSSDESDSGRGPDNEPEDSVIVMSPFQSYQNNLVDELKQIFPDRDTAYLKRLVSDNRGLRQDALVSKILDESSTELGNGSNNGSSVIFTPERRKSAAATAPPVTSTPQPGPSNGRKKHKADKSLGGAEAAASATAEIDREIANCTLDLGNQTIESGDLVNGNGRMDQVYANLCGIFPHLDPEYLKKEAERIGDDEEKLQLFIDTSVGKSGLPSRKEYDTRHAKSEEIRRIKKLTAGDFLRDYEDPMEHFYSNTSTPSEKYKASTLKYLRKKFPNITEGMLKTTMEKHKNRFLPVFKQLEKAKSSKRNENVPVRSNDKTELDPVFFKEYIFMKLESKIKEAKVLEEEAHQKKIENARKTGAFFTCGCCFDNECLLEEVYMCSSDHMFCGDCMRRGAGVQIGDNKVAITCFSENCDNEFDLVMLKKVLRRKVYDKLVERKQAEDVAQAGIQNLVTCPACSYAVIVPESEKLIKCGSADCGKISCKLCREESHLPLRCDEVEKDEEVKDRIRLENAMTEAMVRECPKCKNRFFKTDGCNLMRCTCKATMCYLCRKLVPDNYKHFYGQGAEPRPGLCPLFSDNKNLHKAEVARAAEAARKKVKGNLKHDPTKNLDRPPAGYDPTAIHQVDEMGGHSDDDTDDDNDDDEDDDDDSFDDDDFDEQQIRMQARMALMGARVEDFDDVIDLIEEEHWEDAPDDWFDDVDEADDDVEEVDDEDEDILEVDLW